MVLLSSSLSSTKFSFKYSYASLIFIIFSSADFIPIAGYTDDVAGMIFAIKKCMDYVDDEIKQNVSSKLVAWFDVEKDYVDDLLKDI